MTDRPTITLTPGARDQAHAWVEKALRLWQPGAAWVMELRPARRSDAQNVALWSLLGQIVKARPVHNGVQMDAETYKCLFLAALGREVRFVPTLDGSSMLPLGLRSSKLTKAEFSDLIELILAWCAANDIAVRHFDAANDDRAEAA
jgi:hypothetical protein